MNNLLTTRQVAERLGIHTSTISRWVKDKRIVPAETIIGAFLFTPKSVDKLAAELDAEKNPAA